MCNWDLSLVYTWYRSQSKGSHSDLVSPSTSIDAFTGTTIREANADWKLHFQTLDLSISRDFCFCNLSLTPFAGLKGVYIKDIYDVDYISEEGDPFSVDNLQKFWAVGPKIGFNTSWNFCNHFSFVTETCLSLLWGDYQIKREDLFPILPSSNLNVKHVFNSLRFVPEILIGIQWDYGFCCDLYHVNVLVAWEQQQWINHNQMLYGPLVADSLILNRDSNLDIYGLTLRAQVFF